MAQLKIRNEAFKEVETALRKWSKNLGKAPNYRAKSQAEVKEQKVKSFLQLVTEVLLCFFSSIRSIPNRDVETWRRLEYRREFEAESRYEVHRTPVIWRV